MAYTYRETLPITHVALAIERVKNTAENADARRGSQPPSPKIRWIAPKLDDRRVSQLCL